MKTMGYALVGAVDGFLLVVVAIKLGLLPAVGALAAMMAGLGLIHYAKCRQQGKPFKLFEREG